jgi:hypothetical protein
MTLNEVMDRFEVPATVRYAAGMMMAMKGMSLDDTLGLQIDRAAERVRITLAGSTVLDAPFDEIEAGIRDDGSGLALDGGGPAGGPGLAGA